MFPFILGAFYDQKVVSIKDDPVSLASLIGEIPDVVAVNIINPPYIFNAAYKTLEVQGSTRDILKGGANNQAEVIMPGGSTGVFGLYSTEDIFIAGRVAGETRVVIDIYTAWPTREG